MSKTRVKLAVIAFAIASAISFVAGTLYFFIYLNYAQKIDEYTYAVERLAIVNCLFVSAALFALGFVAMGLALGTRASTKNNSS